MSLNKFVATEAVIPFSDWIGTSGENPPKMLRLPFQVFTMSWKAVRRTAH